MRTLGMTTVFLICTTALSACGPAMRAELEKKPDAAILSALREGGDERVCKAAVINKDWYGPRTQEIARREAALRQLGDCSDEHAKCISFGVPMGTPEYAQCRMEMERIKVQKAHADSASAAASAASLHNTQMYLQSLQPKPTPSINCTSHRMGNFVNTNCQ